MAHGSAAAWGHLNLLGEYDFSEDKLQDSVGINRSRLGSSGIAENPLRPGSWQKSCGTLRTFVGLTPSRSGFRYLINPAFRCDYCVLRVGNDG
jgi:hypothetical protein